MFSLGVGTPAFTADLTTEQKRGFAALAISIGYCMLDQNLASTEQSKEITIYFADAKGISQDELISFSKEPGFQDRVFKVTKNSGGCKQIVEDLKAWLAKHASKAEP